MAGSIPWFQTFNPIYAYGLLTVYTPNADGSPSKTLAPIYTDAALTQAAANPQKLDQFGRREAPLWANLQVAGTIEGVGIEPHNLATTVMPLSAADLTTVTSAMTDVQAAQTAAETARELAETAQAAAEAAASTVPSFPPKASQSGKYCRINRDETGLEYVDPKEVRKDINAEPVDPNILRSGTSSRLTVGFTSDVCEYGETGTGTLTVTLTKESLQTLTVTGSFTIEPPTVENGVAVIIATTDGIDGHVITTKNFVMVNGSYDNTASKVHRFIVTKVGSTSILDIDEVS